MGRPGFALGALLLSSTCLAQTRDPAAAEELFVEGRAAMDRADFTTACSRFQESQRLDPAAGTLINWAECLNRLGKLASSRIKWREALDALPVDDERRAAAAERIAILETSVPRLELRLAPQAPPGTVVKRDGIAVDPVALGLAIPVDPGVHELAVLAPGRVESDVTAKLSAGEHRVLVLEPGPPMAVPLPVPLATPSPHEHAAPLAAWIVSGIGAASLITGATFGILAIVEKGRMDDDCARTSGARVCGESGLGAARNGQTFATIANVTVPIGIAGLGVGGFLFWSSARDSDGAPASHTAQLSVARAF
ncbi:MAG TPA: hypothetical protein VH062_05355 [Polyangiaceae bacterium]|nr:hypothetical protein [Polyangiaceae bacterium]